MTTLWFSGSRQHGKQEDRKSMRRAQSLAIAGRWLVPPAQRPLGWERYRLHEVESEQRQATEDLQ
jgi:hypothetical protein